MTIKTRVVLDHADGTIQQAEAKIRATAQKSGIKAVAVSMSNPMKTRMDYKATARKVYLLDKTVPAGQPIFYEGDVNTTIAITCAQGAGSYGIDVNPQKIFLSENTFQMKAYVPRDFLFTRTYDVVNRAKERLAEGGAIREDLTLYGLASVAANSGLGHNVVASNGRFDLSLVAAAKSLIKGYINDNPSAIILNPSAEKGIMATNRLNMSEKGMQEIQETGELGNMYGITNIVSTVLTEPGTVLMTAAPELFGKYWVRADSLVDEFPVIDRARYGFAYYHMWAAAITNPWGVAQINFNASV